MGSRLPCLSQTPGYSYVFIGINKKGPGNSGAFRFLKRFFKLCVHDVDGLRALRSVGHFKLHFLAFVEGLEAFHLYLGEMHEHVLAFLR